MAPREPHESEQWEDIVRRLGGTPDQARTPPTSESPTEDLTTPADTPMQGPRDYQLAEEIVEDFQPPNPKPIASGNPRTVLSWFGVIGAILFWILAALLSWPLPWWLTAATLAGFFGGALSLFFLLPKTWAHRERFEGDDFGGGARL